MPNGVIWSALGAENDRKYGLREKEVWDQATGSRSCAALPALSRVEVSMPKGRGKWGSICEIPLSLAPVPENVAPIFQECDLLIKEEYLARRVYVDSSVIGGLFDEEFSMYSQRLLGEFKAGLHVPVLSGITEQEMVSAPARVKAAHDELLQSAEYIEVTGEAVELSQRYLREGGFPKRMQADALHIAIATISRVDVLVSWNFRDIVNLNRIAVYNAVNIRHGYPMMEIRNPREVIHE